MKPDTLTKPNPDEPKFDIGDWLIDTKDNERPLNTVFKVEDTLTRYRASDVALWKPKFTLAKPFNF